MTNQLPAAPHQVEIPKLSQEIRDFSEIIARKGAALDRAPYAIRAYVYNGTTPRVEIWPLDPAARTNPTAVYIFSAIWGYTAVEHLAAYLLTIAPRADWR